MFAAAFVLICDTFCPLLCCGLLQSQLAQKSNRLGSLEESLSSLHRPHALDGTLLARLSHLVGSLEEDSRSPGPLSGKGHTVFWVIFGGTCCR